jgi:hypothetical protein
VNDNVTSAILCAHHSHDTPIAPGTACRRQWGLGDNHVLSCSLQWLTCGITTDRGKTERAPLCFLEELAGGGGRDEH